MNNYHLRKTKISMPFLKICCQASLSILWSRSVLLMFICIVFCPALTSAKTATSNEEYAINLWTNTCLIDGRNLDTLEKNIKRDINRGNISLLDEEAAKEELRGREGLAWAHHSKEFGKFIIMWWESGECLIVSDKSDTRNAQDYFDFIVDKDIPDEWQVNKLQKRLSDYSERITYRILSKSGRKIMFELITSTKAGGRQLIIITKYQQPGEVWQDW